jgi:hypothetical protein
MLVWMGRLFFLLVLVGCAQALDFPVYWDGRSETSVPMRSQSSGHVGEMALHLDLLLMSANSGIAVNGTHASFPSQRMFQAGFAMMYHATNTTQRGVVRMLGVKTPISLFPGTVGGFADKWHVMEEQTASLPAEGTTPDSPPPLLAGDNSTAVSRLEMKASIPCCGTARANVGRGDDGTKCNSRASGGVVSTRIRHSAPLTQGLLVVVGRVAPWCARIQRWGEIRPSNDD